MSDLAGATSLAESATGRFDGSPSCGRSPSATSGCVWVGESVSLLGDQFHFVALSWLVLGLTGSGLRARHGPHRGGHPAGRLHARRRGPRPTGSRRASLILASNILRAVVDDGITVLVVTGQVELWHLVVLAVIFGTVDALFFPAMNTLIPLLVPVERLPAANGLVQATQQLAGLVGPAVAGVVVALVGTAPAFAIDAASFAFAALMIAAIHGGRRSAPAAPSATDPAADRGRRVATWPRRRPRRCSRRSAKAPRTRSPIRRSASSSC